MAKDKIIFVNFTKLNCQELEMIYKWRTSDSISKYMETSADFTLDSHLKSLLWQFAKTSQSA